MKQLAVIKNVHFGVRDTNHAMLSFDVYTSENTAALICISEKEALELIDKHSITDIKYLEGKTCWVETDGITSVHFVDFTKI